MNRQNILLVASASLATALAMLAVPAVGQLIQQTPPPTVSAANPAPASPDPAPQADRTVPTSQLTIQQSFAPIVQRTAPAVVNVFTAKQMAVCPYTDPFYAQFYCGQNAGRMERRETSLGSGVLVGNDGVIVTNNHVVASGDEFRVVLSDRREFPATLVMADAHSDLAVLRIDAKGEALPTLDYADTRGVQVGDLVLAIGNPFGVGQSVSSGIVSALARTDVGVSDISSFIQTDASINPGNSGGALVDMHGRLVGVNSMIFSKGGGSNGIGFAIPSEMVKRVVDAAVHGGTLVRPWIGAGGDPVTSAMTASLGLDRPRGVKITNVYPGSPAEKAGVKKGDVILSIDGREVFDEKGMKFVAATKAEGEMINISVLSGGKQRVLQARLAAPPGATKAELIQVSGRNPFNGTQVAEVSPALAEELGLDPFKFENGVMIYTLPGRTYAARAGFQPGDIIREINGVSIKTAKEFNAAVKRAEGGDGVWRLAIERDGQRTEIQLR